MIFGLTCSEAKCRLFVPSSINHGSGPLQGSKLLVNWRPLLVSVTSFPFPSALSRVTALLLGQDNISGFSLDG